MEHKILAFPETLSKSFSASTVYLLLKQKQVLQYLSEINNKLSHLKDLTNWVNFYVDNGKPCKHFYFCNKRNIMVLDCLVPISI